MFAVGHASEGLALELLLLEHFAAGFADELADAFNDAEYWCSWTHLTDQEARDYKQIGLFKFVHFPV